jgi:hypothetical protein
MLPVKLRGIDLGVNRRWQGEQIGYSGKNERKSSELQTARPNAKNSWHSALVPDQWTEH